MHNEVFIAGTIFLRMKRVLGLQKNKDLAEKLGVSPNILGTWKTRNTIPFELIISKCSEWRIDPMQFFFDTANLQNAVCEPSTPYGDDAGCASCKSLEVECSELRGQVKLLRELLAEQGRK
jgi:hypothetical protein